jgi:hypothetical protein
MFGSNHNPLRTPRREADAELRAVHPGRLQHARNTLALEQALDHLGLDPIGGEHDLDQVGIRPAIRFHDLGHSAKRICAQPGPLVCSPKMT